MMHWCKISWISRLLGQEKQSSLVSRILKTLVYNPPAKVIFQLNYWAEKVWQQCFSKSFMFEEKLQILLAIKTYVISLAI